MTKAFLGFTKAVRTTEQLRLKRIWRPSGVNPCLVWIQLDQSAESLVSCLHMSMDANSTPFQCLITLRIVFFFIITECSFPSHNLFPNCNLCAFRSFLSSPSGPPRGIWLYLPYFLPRASWSCPYRCWFTLHNLKWAQFSQHLLKWQVLPLSDHLIDHPFDSPLFLSVFLVPGIPKPDTRLQIWSHKFFLWSNWRPMFSLSFTLLQLSSVSWVQGEHLKHIVAWKSQSWPHLPFDNPIISYSLPSQRQNVCDSTQNLPQDTGQY